MAASGPVVRRSRPALWALGAVAVIVIAAAFVPQQIVAWRLETALRQSLGGQVGAQVEGLPWNVLQGAFVVLQLDVRGGSIDRLTIDRLFLRLRDARVDLGTLLRESRLVVRSVAQGEGEATLSRGNLETYFAAAKNVRQATVSMEAGLLTVEGDVKVGELDLRARIVGRLVIASPRTVDLHVQELTVSGVQIPREVGALLVAAFNPLIDLTALPFPARISSVAVEGGQTVLAVRMEGP